MFGGLDGNISNAIGNMLGANKLNGGSTYDSAINTILSTDWGHASLFQIVKLHLKRPVPSPATSTIFNNNINTQILNASILNIETSTVTETPIEEWIGGKWVYTHGRPEMRQVTFTFRDAANSWLYRNFAVVKNQIRNVYPDDQKWVIQVDTHGDIVAGTANKGRYDTSSEEYYSRGTLVFTEHAILESVSSVSLDQSNYDGFLTFSVTFKYMNPIHNTNLNGDTTMSQTDTTSGGIK